LPTASIKNPMFPAFFDLLVLRNRENTGLVGQILAKSYDIRKLTPGLLVKYSPTRRHRTAPTSPFPCNSQPDKGRMSPISKDRSVPRFAPYSLTIVVRAHSNPARLLAKQLYQRGVPVTSVENAFTVAAALSFAAPMQGCHAALNEENAYTCTHSPLRLQDSPLFVQ
jgi:hypothetical protein